MLRAISTLRLRTDDADAAQERLGREFGGHSRVPAARAPMGYELFAVGTPRVMAGTTTARVGSTVRAATAGPTLHVPLAAAAHCRLGRKEMQAGGDVAVVLARAAILGALVNNKDHQDDYKYRDQNYYGPRHTS